MNKRNFFQRLKSSSPAAHMTWASGTMAGTIVRTRHFLKHRLWAWPIIAVLLLLAISWGVHGAIERTMEANLLGVCPEVTEWSVDKADIWWGQHERGQTPDKAAATISNQYGQTIDHT